jgi:hypothetical protein
MKLEVKFVEVDSANILLYDKTQLRNSNFPPNIFSIKMDIISANIPNGIIRDIDILAYIQENKRDYEMYRITGSVLGLKEGIDIPDGVYTVVIKINNIVDSEHSIAVVTEVKEAVRVLSEQIPISADIKENDLFINSKVDNSTVMKWLYVVSLYYKLIQDTTKTNNFSRFNDDLDKLRRVLLIVKNLVNG